MIMDEWKRRPEIAKGMANLRNRGAELDSIGICYFGQYSEAGQLKVPGEGGLSSAGRK